MDDLEVARHYLAQAQSLNEIEGMQGHAFFAMGCAVNYLIKIAEKAQAAKSDVLQDQVDRAFAASARGSISSVNDKQEEHNT